MAFNHKFLATKSWNVHNAANIQRVAEAEALQASLQRRVEERKRTLEREKIRQQSMAMLASGSGSGGGKSSHAQVLADSSVSGQASSVAFLYEPPPGFIPAPLPPRVIQADEITEVHDLTKHELGAAAAAASSTTASASSSVAPLPINAPPTRLPGADGSIPADESHEDRRARHRGMSVQAVREELHPALRGAPVTAPHVRNMHFTAKPLGILLRDTRCVKCGAVGHSSIDRECPLFGAVDTRADQSRLVREDPLTKLHALAAPSHAADSTGAAAAAAPSSSFGVPSGTGSGVAGGKHGQFRLVYNDEKYSLGGLAADHPLQQVLLDSDDASDDERQQRGVKAELEAARRSRGRRADSHVKTEGAHQAAASHAASSSSGATATPSLSSSSSSGALTPAELAFYSTLPSTDMKLLLRQLRKARDANERRSSDSSSSSSGSSSDEDDGHRKHRHKKSKSSRHESSSRSHRRRSSSSRHKHSKHSSSKSSHKDKDKDKESRKHSASSRSRGSSKRSSSPAAAAAATAAGSSSRRHKHHKRKRSDSAHSDSSSSDDDRDRRSSRRSRHATSRSALPAAVPSATMSPQLPVVPASVLPPSPSIAAVSEPLSSAAVPALDESDQLPPLEFAAAPSALLATLTQPTLTQQRA